MTAIFIILAHKEPEQVARLAKRLSPHKVLVHIDSKVSPSNYQKFENCLADESNVKLLKRFRSAWASWGIVEASLEGLRSALELTDCDWTHAMVISGEDYSIVNSTKISDFLSKYKDSSFIPNWELPHKIWGKDGGMYRLKYWHKPICKRRFFIPVPRKFPGNLTPYGGSMFWCLNREVVRYVINYVDKFQKEVSFFKNVWIPDEIFIPTVVMNSPFKSTCINENLIYIRWSILGSPHPDYLDASDANEIKKAGSEPSIRGGKSRIKLFARKIDASKGIPLMNILDNET